MASRATREQARAETELNRARGGGPGGGGSGRGSGSGNIDPGGDALDLSAAFERNAQDIIRQDRHLTRVLQAEDNKRQQLERQAQKEVSQILERGARDQEKIERDRFAANRRQRERDHRERVQAANSLVDLLFSTNNQVSQAQERANREQERYNEERARQINRATRIIEIGLLELFFTLHSLARPISEITNALEDFLSANISASAEVEKFSSTLKIASGSAASADLALQRLLDITTELAAIDTASLIQFSARLQTAGLSAQQAENSIVAVTRRMEEQGKGAAQTVRVLEQFVQAINANLITMQDFRPILREYPLLYRDFSEALGRPINDLDSFRAAAEEVGGATDAIVLALEHVARVAQGAEFDTINRQLDEFRDRVFVLQAALGDALRPVVIEIIKIANRFLETLEGLNITMRVFLGVVAATGVAIGRLTGFFIQLGIIGIVGLQIQGAVIQITAMTNSLNSVATAITGTTAAMATLPAHLASATRWLNIISAVLPKVALGFGALAIVIPTAAAAYTAITQHITAANKEYENFLSTLTALPDAVMGGSDAITEQLRQLTEFRSSLIETRQELIESADQFDTFFERIVRRVAQTSPQLLAFAPAVGLLDFLRDRTLEDRLVALGDQAEATQQNIKDLGIAFDIDVSQFVKDLDNQTKTLDELEVATINAISSISDYGKNLVPITEQSEALRRVTQRMIDEFYQLRDAGDDTQARALAIAIQRLIDNFINFNKEIEPQNITNYNEELIKLDFTIRRLEGAFRRLEVHRFVGNIGGTRNLQQIENLFSTLETNLKREAELERLVAEQRGKERGDTEQETSNEITKINERLRFDLEELTRQRDEFIDKIDEESFNRRVGRLNRYRKFASDFYEYLIKKEEEYHEHRRAVNRAITGVDNFRNRLVDAQIEGLGGLITTQLASLQAFSDFVAEQVRTRGEILLTAEAVNSLSQSFLNLTEATNAFRRASDETEVFRFIRPTGATRDSGLPAIERNPRTDVLDPDDITGEFGRRAQDIQDITDAAVRAAQDIERQNERIVRSFSRGVSRALTDFIFDGEATFQEFLLEFAKTTSQVIIQSRLEAEILKRIDDDVTEHRISNIRRVAAERARGGLTASNLTPDIISSFSPTTGLLSGTAGAIISAGVIGYAIYNAVKQGFEDSDVTIEADSQEIGRVAANSIRRGIRRGEFRL